LNHWPTADTHTHIKHRSVLVRAYKYKRYTHTCAFTHTYIQTHTHVQEIANCKTTSYTREKTYPSGSEGEGSVGISGLLNCIWSGEQIVLPVCGTPALETILVVNDDTNDDEVPADTESVGKDSPMPTNCARL
jgi:hypothetical protein